MPKRLFDILFSSMAIVLLSPLMAVTAILIKLNSPGGVFFRQVRVGKGQALFRIFKFRTMVANARDIGPQLTEKDDPRITRVGKFLRRTKLDELPQLFNVLKGDMSIVGPRPEIPDLVESYSDDQKRIFNVKPGMTSPASIFFRDEEERVNEGEDIFDQHRDYLVPAKLGYDLDYVATQSLGYDLRLIVLTLLKLRY